MPQYGFDAANFTAIQRGDTHAFTRRLGMSGVSLHPLQRIGAVSSVSHSWLGRQGAASHPTIGDGPAAGHMNLTLPPLVPISGTPRDPRFMI